MFTAISLGDFQKRTGTKPSNLNSGWEQAETVVSLRDLTRIVNIQIMSVAYLEGLVWNTVLEGNNEIRPYEGCRVERARMDPSNLLVGQTFVERPKYQRLVEDLASVFDAFCTNKGFAKCTSLIVLGTTRDEKMAVSHYIPPIVEEQNGGLYLLDGMHRNFLTRAIGTTIETIIIKRVRSPFPCQVRDWGLVKVVEQKPPRPERFFDLKPELFRDLKWVGIDG